MDRNEYREQIITLLDQRPRLQKGYKPPRLDEGPVLSGKQAYLAACLLLKAKAELSAADFELICVRFAAKLNGEELARYLAFGKLVIPPEHHDDLPISWSTFREIKAIVEKSHRLGQGDRCLRRAFMCGCINPHSTKRHVDHVDDILCAELGEESKATRHPGRDQKRPVTQYQRDLLMGRLGDAALLKERACSGGGFLRGSAEKAA